MYWFLFALGIFTIAKTWKENSNKGLILPIITSVGVSLLIMPVWPFVVDRVMFMIAPFLIIIVCYSFRLFKSQLILVAIGGFINIFTTFLIYRFNYNNLLLYAGIAYLAIIFLFFLIEKKSNKIEV